MPCASQGCAAQRIFECRNLTAPAARSACLSRYHRRADFLEPVFADPSPLEAPFHASAHCPTPDLTPCDASRVDSSIAFVWGSGAPLALAGLGLRPFPADYWSVRWVGFLSAPAAGTVQLLVETDDDAKVRLVAGGVVVFDTISSGPGGGPPRGNVTFDSTDELVELRVEYVEGMGDAAMTLRWRGPGVEGEPVVPSSHLFHKRHIARSPYVVSGP